MKAKLRFVFASTALVVSSLLPAALNAAPQPIIDASECGGIVFNQAFVNPPKVSFTSLLLNYDQYAKKIPDGRYLLCFGPKYTDSVKESSATLTGKPGKPVVVYGLNWSRKDLVAGSSLFIVKGEQALLQGVNFTANTTALRIEGTGNGIVDSEITGTSGASSIGIDVTGNDHNIGGNTTISKFATGIVLGATTQKVAITKITMTGTADTDSVGIDILGGSDHNIDGGTKVNAFANAVRLGTATTNVLVNDITVDAATPASANTPNPIPIADSTGLHLAGTGHFVSKNVVSNVSTAIRAEGQTITIGPDNLIDGTKYGVYVTTTGQRVKITGNSYEEKLPECSSESDEALKCQIFIETNGNKNVSAINLDLAKSIKWSDPSQDMSFSSITFLSPYKSAVEFLVRKSVPDEMGRVSYKSLGERNLVDATNLASLNLMQLWSQLIPQTPGVLYGAMITDVSLLPDNYAAIIRTDSDGNSSSFSNAAVIKELTNIWDSRTWPTTPGGVAIIASGGYETGGSSLEGTGSADYTPPSPADAPPTVETADDQKAKMAGAETPGAVIVGSGEAGPLGGIAGPKAGCALIIR